MKPGIFTNFLVIFFLAVTCSVSGQVSLGGRAGVTFSTLIGSAYMPKPGLHAGLFGKIPVSERIGIQPELVYVQRGGHTSLKDVEQFYNPYNQQMYRREKLTLDYLDLSLLIRYNITRGIYWLGGFKGAVLLQGMQRFTNGYRERQAYRFGGARNFDLALELGIGIETKRGIVLGLRGDLGVVPVSQIRQYHNLSFQATIGYVVCGKRRR